MTTPPLQGDAAIYTKPVLAVYDPIALGMVCPLAWRCSRRTMLDFYDANISDRHLDVGPGTGFFLDRCRFPSTTPEIAVVDLNETVLDTVAGRIARYRPATYVRDVLQPLDLGRTFRTAGVLNVLHCLPGTIRQKVEVLDHVRAHVEPGGRIFGSTVLGRDVRLSRFGNWLMRQYNRAGSFRNTGDSLEGLDAALAERFDTYRLKTVGAMAFFTIDV